MIDSMNTSNLSKAHEMRDSLSSLCSQVVFLSPAISTQYTLFRCASQPKIAKNLPKTAYFGFQGQSWSSWHPYEARHQFLLW